MASPVQLYSQREELEYRKRLDRFRRNNTEEGYQRYLRRYQQPKAAIAFVQSTNATGGALGSLAVAFVSNNAAGNLIVVYGSWNLNTLTASVSDTRGNTYAAAGVQQTDIIPNSSGEIFFAKNVAAGANTVTLTLSGTSTNFIYILIHEYSGAERAEPLDQTSSANGSSTAMDSGSKTTLFASELIFGAGTSDSSDPTAGAGFTIREVPAGKGVASEDNNVIVVGSNNATEELPSAQGWIMLMATFRAGIAAEDDGWTPPRVLLADPDVGVWG